MTARFRLVAFDLYGTVLDISRLAGQMSAALGHDASALLAAWRIAQLERTWELNQLGTYEPFDRVTAWSLAKVAGEHGVSIDAPTQQQMTDAWLTLPAHPDAGAAFARMAAAGVQTAILSNGTRAMVERALVHAGLRVDHVLSVDAIQRYKPDPRVYALLDALAPAPDVLFVSSNAFDAEGAKRNGRTVAFIDRGHAQPGVEPDFRVRALSEIAAVAGA